MQDTVSVKLPVSGKEVIVRNYTTRADDKNAEAVMSQGVNAEQTTDGTQNITFPVANVMESETSYVYRLVQSVDGTTTGLADLLDNLHSKDFEAVKQAVDAIVDENSPKAIAAGKSLNPATAAK